MAPDSSLVSADSARAKVAEPATCTMVARYTIDAAVNPLSHRTVAVAHQVRRALLSRVAQSSSDAEQTESEIFAGKDRHRQPLLGHRHAYFLPTDEDGDGRLDHVTVCAARHFGPSELAALVSLNRLTMPGRGPIALALQVVGQAADLRAPLFAESAEWISSTPFVVTRHAKPRGRRRDPSELLGRYDRLPFARHVLLEEIARLLERRPEVPRPIAVDALPDQRIGPRRLAPYQFQRHRKATDDTARRPCGAFRIVFAAPVRGPICLGLHAHFGLGLFLPAEAASHPLDAAAPQHVPLLKE